MTDISIDPTLVEEVARVIDPDAWLTEVEFTEEYGGFPQWSSGSQGQRRIASLERATAALAASGLVEEVARLRGWKAEALPVMSGLQDLGHALGLPLGTSITGRLALDAVLDLRALLASPTTEPPAGDGQACICRPSHREDDPICQYRPAPVVPDGTTVLRGAAAILAAMHVVTGEELDALPDDTVIRDTMGDVGIVHGAMVWYPETAPLTRANVAAHYLPATVLHRPDPSGADSPTKPASDLDSGIGNAGQVGEAARAEAERRGRDDYWCGDSKAFIAGATWQALQPVVGAAEQVEALKFRHFGEDEEDMGWCVLVRDLVDLGIEVQE